MRIWLLSIQTFLVMGGCSPSHTITRQKQSVQVPQRLVESVSFNELYTKVLEPKCIGCHSGNAKTNLTSYESVKALAAKIETMTLTTRQMPKLPMAPLEDAETQVIAAWIKAGAPEIPLNGEVAPEIAKLEPTFTSIKSKILTPRCLSCHRAGGAARDISLTSPQAMIDSPLEIVIPENPEESGIMIVIQEGARKKMPPLESDFQPLNDAEIQVLSEWIARGAKD
jgi:uncharacterized membrane protein